MPLKFKLQKVSVKEEAYPIIMYTILKVQTPKATSQFTGDLINFIKCESPWLIDGQDALFPPFLPRMPSQRMIYRLSTSEQGT